METTIKTESPSSRTITDSSPASQNVFPPEAPQPALGLRSGGCHCGAVRFEVTLDTSQPGSRCNCSVCTKTGVTSKITKPSAFTLLAGEDALTSYAWGAQISRRFFCRHCGVHCFARGFLAEVGGDYVSINVNCIDGLDPASLALVYWDGRHDNWQAGPRSTPWPVGAPSSSRQGAPSV